MLRNKNRVSLERRLLPIVGWERGGETALDEIGNMLENCRHPFAPEILALPDTE